jgi:hypothetical protein
MKQSATAQCARAVSLFRGLYGRVAHNLGVDVSYISRIARGQRKSKVGERALAREFNRVVAAMRKDLGRSGTKLFVVVTLQCPRCRIQQIAQIATRIGFGRASGEKTSCIHCGHHFKITIPDKIIRGPFPA